MDKHESLCEALDALTDGEGYPVPYTGTAASVIRNQDVEIERLKKELESERVYARQRANQADAYSVQIDHLRESHDAWKGKHAEVNHALSDAKLEIDRLQMLYEGEVENRLNIAKSHDLQTAEIARLQEVHKRDLAEYNRVAAEVTRLRSEIERYELGIRWALGESPEGTPEFPVVTSPPYYRWRTTLRELTGIMPKTREALRDE